MKRINQLTPAQSNLLTNDRLVIDRVNGGGTFTTYYISGQELINATLAQNKYTTGVGTNSIIANIGGVTADGHYSYASGQDVAADGNNSFIHSKNSTVTGARSAIIGGQGLTNAENDMVLVPNLKLVEGGIIKSNSGSGELNLRHNNTDDVVLLSNDSGQFNNSQLYLSPSYIELSDYSTGGFIGLYTNDTQINIGELTLSAYNASGINSKRYGFETHIGPSSLIESVKFGVSNSSGQNYNIITVDSDYEHTTNANRPNTTVISSTSTNIKSGVVESVVIGGNTHSIATGLTNVQIIGGTKIDATESDLVYIANFEIANKFLGKYNEQPDTQVGYDDFTIITKGILDNALSTNTNTFYGTDGTFSNTRTVTMSGDTNADKLIFVRPTSTDIIFEIMGDGIVGVNVMESITDTGQLDLTHNIGGGVFGVRLTPDSTDINKPTLTLATDSWEIRDGINNTLISSSLTTIFIGSSTHNSNITIAENLTIQSGADLYLTALDNSEYRADSHIFKNSIGNIVASVLDSGISIGDDAFGNGSNNISIKNGFPPGFTISDSFHMYSNDIVAGNATPHFRTELGNIIKLYKLSDNSTVRNVLERLGFISLNKLAHAQSYANNEIEFIEPAVYGTFSSPRTGDLTNNLTEAKIGTIQKIYHNDSVEPNYPAGWVLVGSGEYLINELNIIHCEWSEGTRVEYWITQEAI